MNMFEHIGQLYIALHDERAKSAQLIKDIETYKGHLMEKLMKDNIDEPKDERTDPE